MPARGIDEPPFDLLSYARPGPGRRDRLTPEQLQRIARTVGRTPEVMVKVLSHGASDLGAVRRHLDYIGRKGHVLLETDDDQRLRGEHVSRNLIDDWDLELDAQRARADLVSRPGRQPPGLVHKLVFSMPPGTLPEKVLGAVRNFCREEFGLKHRYAMVLHTDEPHPHVHVILKAMSEEGIRLNIRKDTLRDWREKFARHLRTFGIEANATPRAVRGQHQSRKVDAIYRAQQRGDSQHTLERVQAVAASMVSGEKFLESGRSKLIETRRQVEQVWFAISDAVITNGDSALAERIHEFVAKMAPPRTEREQIAEQLRRQLEKARVPERRR